MVLLPRLIASIAFLFVTSPAFVIHSWRAEGFSSATVRPIARLSKVACLQAEKDGGDDDNFWRDRWEAADKLEIRLDSTIVSCHTLARFLAYDISLPPKEIPGIELVDVVALLDTFTSASILALLWTASGLVTRIFEESQDWGRLVQTTILAAPLWLILELALGWPATDGGPLERIAVGSLGLLATMSLARLVPKYL